MATLMVSDITIHGKGTPYATLPFLHVKLKRNQILYLLYLVDIIKSKPAYPQINIFILGWDVRYNL